MPFSSQPRKKGQQPQDLVCKNHTGSCDCLKKNTPLKSTDTIKKELMALREKIADKFIKDPRAAEKAALILSLWIQQTNTKKKK